MKISCRSNLLLLCAALLSGCLDYAETWTLAADGSGTIRIACSPSSAWNHSDGTSAWLDSQLCFAPPLHAVSQACVRSGLTLISSSVTRQPPRIALLFSFDSIRQVSRCSLFADRLLQISRGRRRITFLHKLQTTESILPSVYGHSWSPAWLENSSVEFRVNFPGPVIDAEGAERHGRYVSHRTNLSRLFSTDKLLIIATAHTASPWWQRLAAGLLVCLLPAVIVVMFVIRYYRNKRLYDSAS